MMQHVEEFASHVVGLLATPSNMTGIAFVFVFLFVVVFDCALGLYIFMIL